MLRSTFGVRPGIRRSMKKKKMPVSTRLQRPKMEDAVKKLKKMMKVMLAERK